MLNSNVIDVTIDALAAYIAELNIKDNLTDGQKLNREYAKAANELMKSLREGDTIASLWTTEDVFSVMFPEDSATRRYTTEDVSEARKVLKAVDDNHDAEIGINWDVIKYHAEN